MARVFTIERSRHFRIDEARREALHSGLRISPELRAAIDSGDADATARAVGRALKSGVALPRVIVAGYRYLCTVQTMSVCESFARDVRDALVNVPTIESEARHAG